MGKRFLRYNKKTGKVEEHAEAAPPKPGVATWHNKWSTAMGVQEAQIPDARRELDSLGFHDTAINQQGDIQVKSSRHQRKLARALGLVNKQDYYA